MTSHNRSRCRFGARHLAIAMFLIISSPDAYASTSSGIDTTPGVTTLPLAVEGEQGIELSKQSNGDIYVSVGTTSAPEAPLDVNGGIRGNNSSVVVGSGCSPEGMLGYDLTNHEPVYCSSSGAWTAFVSGLVWGGSYTTCTASCSGCVTNNPFVSPASCNCPSGYTARALTHEYVVPGNFGETTYYCLSS